MRRCIAVTGASAGIGRALVRELAREGNQLVIGARDFDELERTAADARARYGADVCVLPFDGSTSESAVAWWQRADEAYVGGLDGLVVCHGSMQEQATTQNDSAAFHQMFEINTLAVAALLEQAASALETRRLGVICAVSSVAGDRGRASKYHYGASKAALDALLEGMRARLHASGVRVVTVKPGFVDTQMTYGAPGIFLAAHPSRAARDIARALRSGPTLIYTPSWWRGVMAIIRAIPRPIFQRLPL